MSSPLLHWKTTLIPLGIVLFLTACPSEDTSKKAADEVLRTEQINKAKELDKTIQNSQTKSRSQVEESPSASPTNL